MGQELTAAAVADILKDVFASMVNLPLADAPEGAAVAGQAATAIVGLIGKPGRIAVLKAGERLARGMAGGMLMADYPAWNDEVRDAFAEIANMTAGNIKARCFADLGLSLSLPTVLFGSDYSMSSARLRPVAEYRGASGGEIIQVTVAEEI